MGNTTPALLQLIAKANPAQREYLQDMRDHYLAQFRASNSMLFDRKGVAAGTHDAMDNCIDVMKRTDKNAKRIACRKGCAHCCHIPVDITRDEALLLKAAAADAGIAIDRDLLRRQAEGEWKSKPLEERRCVFLTAENACGVHDHRPNSCRKYHVLDDPKQCDTVKFYGRDVAMLVSIEGECLQAAAFTAFRSGSMASMLLEVTE